MNADEQKQKQMQYKKLLFLNDNEYETRYIVAELIDDNFIIRYSDFNHKFNKIIDYITNSLQYRSGNSSI